MFSRQQLKHAATLTEENLKQISNCRRPYNRLGFAYQVAFVRLLNRFPRQQPFEIVEELASFSAAQLGFDVRLLELYRKRQPTISEHQETITRYLGLRHFGDAEAAQLEKFVFEESWHLEQTSASRPKPPNFLKNSAFSNQPSSESFESWASNAPEPANTSSDGSLRRSPNT